MHICFFCCTPLPSVVLNKKNSGEVAERLTKSSGTILNINVFLLMARRAKYMKYFVTRSPSGVRLAQSKPGREIARKPIK